MGGDVAADSPCSNFCLAINLLMYQPSTIATRTSVGRGCPFSSSSKALLSRKVNPPSTLSCCSVSSSVDMLRRFPPPLGRNFPSALSAPADSTLNHLSCFLSCGFQHCLLLPRYCSDRYLLENVARPRHAVNCKGAGCLLQILGALVHPSLMLSDVATCFRRRSCRPAAA